MKTAPIICPYALLSMKIIKEIRWEKKTALKLETLRQGIG